jgi:oligopeptide transport system substrate-binding protein
MKMKSRSIIVFILFLSALFSSCGQERSSTFKRQHHLRMNVMREPSTLDPRQGSEFIGSTLQFYLFEGLTRLNTDYSVALAQAKSVELSEDRKTYTFHLRGTTWSDGTPVVAADFEHAWKKILTPEFPAANAPLLYLIKNAEQAKKGILSIDQVGIWSLDDKTLVVELEHPTPYFLELVSFCLFFPVKHSTDLSHPNWMNDAGKEFLCNGPFKLASWKHNNEILFEKNPHYWEQDQINVEKIQVSMVKDENTILKMYENNELDFIELSSSPIPTDVMYKYYAKGLLKTYTSAATTAICFNVTKFPFTNENIRKAFAYAIDRQEIVENISQLGEEVATQMVPGCLFDKKAISYFEDNKAKKAQEQFQQGLQELGITADQFPTLIYYYSFTNLNHRIAQILQEKWSKILGVHVELERNEHKVFIDRLRTHNYEIAQTFWFAQYRDPLSILERFKYRTNPKNYCNWENPDFIALLEKTYTATSTEERMKLLQDAEALIMSEMPISPLYHWKTGFMIKDYLTYEEFSPEHGYLFLPRIRFKSAE